MSARISTPPTDFGKRLLPTHVLDVDRFRKCESANCFHRPHIAEPFAALSLYAAQSLLNDLCKPVGCFDRRKVTHAIKQL
jgi:hypothetical protein